MCTNLPGFGAGKCDSGKVPEVTCPEIMNQCMSVKGKMTVLGFTQSIELKNCSNNVLCDSASDYNGKNSNEFARPPSPPPPPHPFEGDSHVNYTSGMLGVSLWCKKLDFSVSVLDVNAIFCPCRSSLWCIVI